jgi:hypothetical protein
MQWIPFVENATGGIVSSNSSQKFVMVRSRGFGGGEAPIVNRIEGKCFDIYVETLFLTKVERYAFNL